MSMKSVFYNGPRKYKSIESPLMSITTTVKFVRTRFSWMLSLDSHVSGAYRFPSAGKIFVALSLRW